MTHVELAGLTKRFGDAAPVVDRLDLAIAKGEFVTLLGPSGCGKTTTLRMIAGLIEPTAGAIRVSGADVTSLPPYRRNMGLVFQSYALFPHLSAAGNIGFGLVERGIGRAERDERVRQALALVRLAGFEERKPREMSGGQQQRVALARALVVRPDVLLLDESLSNLDAKLREEMRVEIRDIQRELGITTIFVTHDQVEALTLSDRLAVMENGRIVQVGAPEAVYERPATRFVAGFIGRINAFAGEARDGRLLLAGQPTSIAAAGNGPREALVRPHRLRIGAATGAGDVALAGVVRRIVYVGDLVQVGVSTPAGEALVEQPTAGAHWRGLQVGAPVTLAFDATDALVFEGKA